MPGCGCTTKKSPAAVRSRISAFTASIHCVTSCKMRSCGSALARFPMSSVPDIESGAALILEFSRGILGTVQCSFLAEYRTPLELVGESGVLRGDDCLNVERPVTLELRQGGTTVESANVSNQLAYARQVDAFAAAVEGKAAFPAAGRRRLAESGNSGRSLSQHGERQG